MSSHQPQDPRANSLALLLPRVPVQLVAVLLLGAGAANAQSTTPRATMAADGTKDSAVLLSPFEVRDDSENGYTATSALSGGRTDTPLKLTAAAVSVMTSQFLTDIAATDFASASEWATNVVPMLDTSHQVGGGIAINLRNMGQSFQSRNHFMWYVASDAYNVERYEFSRGPNGVLFGDSGAGGLATTLTKRPRFDARKTSFQTRGTSYGGYRATLDHNQPLNRNFALRFNALYEDMPTWRENTTNMRWGAHLAGAYRLTSRNQVRFEIEKGGYERSMLPNYYNDRASYWDGVTAFDGVTAPVTGSSTGVTRISSSPWMVYIPGTANNGVNDYSRYYTTNGTGIALHPAAKQRADIPNIGRLPYKRWNMQPTDSRSTLHFYTYSAFIDHRFSDNFYVELGYNRLRQIYGVHENQLRFADYRLDLNRVLPGGAPNPNFGKPFTDLHRITGQSENTLDDVRVLANYRFEPTGWLKQSFSGIVGSRIDKYNFYGRSLRRTNGPVADVNHATNIIRERRYWDQVGTQFGPAPAIPGWDLEYIPTSHSRQRKTIDYVQLLSISRLFNDRVAISLGARHDGVLNYQETSGGMPRTSNGLPQMGAVLVEPGKNPRNVLGAKARSTFAPTSTNAGIVYYVFRDLGVFANYSETFSTPGNGANYLDGRAPGISQSTGMDVGLKLELFNGRVSGGASYYTSEQVDRPVGGSRVSEMNRIWTNLGRIDREVFNYRDTENIKGDGYEFDINANPTRDLRLMFNLALPKARAVNLRPSLIAYFNENIAEWQRGADDVNNANRQQIQNDINAIRNTIDGLTPGTVFNNTYKYTANVYGTYTLPGAWRDWSVGAGANIRGRNKIGNVQTPTNQPYNYLYSPAYYLVSAHVSYRHEFSEKLSARFQLNITNLLDNDDLIYRNYRTYRVGGISRNPLLQVPGNTAIPDPRKFTLSATFDF